jgi:type II secretory pathway predicted ATPase ExeA
MNAQRSKDLGPRTWDLGLKNSILLSPRFADFSRLTAAGIVAYVLEELGVKPRRALVLAQKQLERRLAHLAQNNITVALCFDECHHLNDTLLTALKNFYELGTGGFERYLGLILFGQPQFAARLELPRFREIAERLACLELPAFSPSTAENYLAHCLDNALLEPPDYGVGAAPSDDATPPANPKSKIQNPKSLFEPEALRLIMARASTPLGIANAASSAMLEAYKKGEHCVLARFVPGDTGPKAMRVGARDHGSPTGTNIKA